MSHIITEPGVIGAQPIASNSTTKNHALGTVVRAEDLTYGGGEFIYLKGLDTTGIGTWVTYNTDDFSSTLLAGDAIGPTAVAMSACVTGEYGWYQIQGKASAKSLADIADGANVYATGTAGAVDDAVVAGDRVKNAKAASLGDSVDGSLSDFEIARPFMDDAVAA